MSDKAPAVAVVLLNWNGWRDTLDCLESLARLSYERYAVVVVDNNSQDDSLARIEAWAAAKAVPLRRFELKNGLPAPVRSGSERPAGFMVLDLISSSVNTGFCTGNNIGLAHAVGQGADYLFVLNNDTLVQSDALEHLVKEAQADPRVGILSPLICYAAREDTIWWAGGRFKGMLAPVYMNQGRRCLDFEDSSPQVTDWASGSAMLMPRATFTAFNGFDSRFFIWCDEWDLSLRVRKAGLKIKVVPRARVYHKVGRSLDIISPLTFYYAGRNMMILRKKHLPRWEWILSLLAAVPLKGIQALYFSLRYRDFLYLHGFLDILRAGPGNGGGIWSRQTDKKPCA